MSLIGESWGGIVALKMAQILESQETAVTVSLIEGDPGILTDWSESFLSNDNFINQLTTLYYSFYKEVFILFFFFLSINLCCFFLTYCFLRRRFLIILLNVSKYIKYNLFDQFFYYFVYDVCSRVNHFNQGFDQLFNGLFLNIYIFHNK